jgi:hypothetical protein
MCGRGSASIDFVGCATVYQGKGESWSALCPEECAEDVGEN